jgi:hypothetical protein
MPTLKTRLRLLEAEVAALREDLDALGRGEPIEDAFIYTPIVHVVCGTYEWQCNNWQHILAMLCQLVQLPQGPTPQDVLQAYCRGLRRIPRDELPDGDVVPIEKCEAWTGASRFAKSRRREQGLAMAALLENAERELDDYPLTQEVVQYLFTLLDQAHGVETSYPGGGRG